jgi:hypothetical protein
MNGKKFKGAFKGVTFKDISDRGCVLCGSGRIAVTGIYLPGPDVQALHGDGRPFAVIYSVCRHCMKVPNAPAKCEDAIHAELGFSERGRC